MPLSSNSADASRRKDERLLPVLELAEESLLSEGRRLGSVGARPPRPAAVRLSWAAARVAALPVRDRL